MRLVAFFESNLVVRCERFRHPNRLSAHGHWRHRTAVAYQSYTGRATCQRHTETGGSCTPPISHTTPPVSELSHWGKSGLEYGNVSVSPGSTKTRRIRPWNAHRHDYLETACTPLNGPNRRGGGESATTRLGDGAWIGTRRRDRRHDGSVGDRHRPRHRVRRRTRCWLDLTATIAKN